MRLVRIDLNRVFHESLTKMSDYLKTANTYYALFASALSEHSFDPQRVRASPYFAHCQANRAELERPFAIRHTTAKFMRDLDIENHALAGALAMIRLGLEPRGIEPVPFDQVVLDIVQEYFKLKHRIVNREPLDPIVVRIDEFGRVVLVEGHHRACLYLPLGIQEVPALVVHRHPRWEMTRAFFDREAETLYGKQRVLYQQIRHPDFADYQVLRDDRFPAIVQALARVGIASGRGLDLGCMIGDVTHRLAQHGYDMTAVDHEEKYLAQAKYFSTYYETNVEFHLQSAFDFIQDCNRRFDFVVALSLFYHLFRNDAARAAPLLRQCATISPYLFVDDEPRTGHLCSDRLREVLSGFVLRPIFVGTDDRTVYVVSPV